MAAIGKLERIELRTLWEHEAHGFTPWLAEHLDVLSESIDYELTIPKRGKTDGAFSDGLFVEGPNGASVVIENQLGQTDHDHLGKVLLYLANLEAKTAIWISATPRPEHVVAVEWLNKVSPRDTSLYIVQLEVYQIGDSPPAPLFTVVSGPTVEGKRRGEEKGKLGMRHLKRKEFWTQLLGKPKETTKLYSNVSAGPGSWLEAGAGEYGMVWGYSIRMHSGAVVLLINRGTDENEETDRFLGLMQDAQDKIEASFGEPLLWDRIDEHRGVRIKSESSIGGWRDENRWPAVQADMIDRMGRLEGALRLFLEGFK